MENAERINDLIQMYREGDWPHDWFLEDVIHRIDEEIDYDILKELAVAACEILEKRILKDISSKVKGSGE